VRITEGRTITNLEARDENQRVDHKIGSTCLPSGTE